jgi:hypothetical protein
MEITEEQFKELENRIKVLEDEKIKVKPYTDIKEYDKLKVNHLFDIDGNEVVSPTFTDYNESQTSPTDRVTWEDWDVSAKVPAGTKSVLVYMRNNDTDTKNLGVRKNGSSSNRIFQILANGNNLTILCEVDDNLILERYTNTTNASDSDFRIIGYFS